MSKPLFTVFTPTFNRAHTLHRVYESLKAQTLRDFEWVIVDDGSNDNTKDLVEKWKQKADFQIRYYYQENKGKHVAFNRGVQEARGKLFLVFDSDDACVPEALERFKYHWDSIPNNRKHLFSGVACLCQDQNGRLIGNKYPYEITESDSLEIYYKYKVKGEKWWFQRIELLRCYPFPEIDGMKFIPEGIVWNAISKSYKILFVNEILRTYWTKESNQSDQLTNILDSTFKHSLGCALYYESCLNEHIDWFRYAPFEFLRLAVHYIRFSLHLKTGILRSLYKIRPFFSKMLVVLAIPIGVFLYAFEKRNINLVLIYKSVIKEI